MVRHLRSSSGIILIAFLAIALLAGCATTEANEETASAIVSDNGEVLFTLPGEWKRDPQVSKQSILGIANRKQQKYALVNSTSKTAMSSDSTLEDYKAIFTENTETLLEDYKELNPSETTVDASPALLFEVTGVAKEINVHYLVAILEKDHAFYQIVTWTTEEKYESNKASMMEVIQSFKLLKQVEKSVSYSSTKPTVTKKSKDGKVQIKVPKGWTDETNLSPDADIQTRNAFEEEYLGVVRELKTDFEAGMTLEDYSQAISDNMSTMFDNPNVTEAKEILINGNRALQYEISGELDKLKIVYLVTLVQSEGYYNQVLFWTMENLMDGKRDMFIQAANTFQAKD